MACALFVGAVTAVRDGGGLARSLGDTDDAMRIVLVRGLRAGQGFWDQNIGRLQPPHGVYMHWSRLLDGAIAAFEGVIGLFAPPPQAEALTRLLWPLFWILPISWAALTLASRLETRPSPGSGGDPSPAGAAPWICALFLVTNFTLYLQFRPGRVDHHDVQMTFFLLALAGASARERPVRGAALAGVATGLGVAVGLEALVFDAIIGAALAILWAVSPRRQRALEVYGLTLAGATLLAFLVQTPPWRWGIPACDALAVNAVAALVAAGLSLAAAARFTSKRGLPARLAALAGGGVLGALAYVALDPGCLKGPFADVDPAIRSFWLVHVQEMRPWLKVLHDKPEDAILLAAAPVMAALALLLLFTFSRDARRDPGLLLSAVLLAATAATGFQGVRMCGYADWVAIPALAAAGAAAAKAAARRFHRPLILTTAFAALLLTPQSAAVIAVQGREWAQAAFAPKAARKRPAPGPRDRCFDGASYAPLARALPSGLVLSEIDLGPFILAHTGDSALAAPYHRMSWGMVAARRALGAPGDGAAEGEARRLGVSYVLECRAHRSHTDREGLAAQSLQKRLDRGDPAPAWLEPLTPANAPLEVFRVRPQAPASREAR